MGSGSLKLGGWQKLQAVGFLKYQNLRFRAHVMDFKDADKSIIEAGGVVDATPQKYTSCLFVAACTPDAITCLDCNGENLSFRTHLMNLKNCYNNTVYA